MDKNGDLWCDYCDMPCGLGIYTAKSHPGMVFCESECRDKFWLSLRKGEEPDVVY